MSLAAFFQRLTARLRAVFQKPTLDADLDEELRHHLECLTEDNLARGMSPAAARRAAHLSLGSIDAATELHRDTRSLPWLEHLAQDLRHTFRQLRRERTFAVIAVLVLAIGVGLNTAVFSLINTVLLRPLPAPAAERLVEISNGDPANADRDLSSRTHRVDSWEGMLNQSRSFDAIEAYDPFSLRQTYPVEIDAATTQTSNLVFVTQGLFPLLGIHPELGRLFSTADAIDDGAPVIIITHQMWQQRFGGDPAIIGRSVRIGGRPITVIGVLPATDTFAQLFYPAVRVDAYAILTPENRRNYGNTLQLIGRLAPDVTPAAADAELDLVMQRLLTEIPNRSDFHRANVAPLHDVLTDRLRQPLLFLGTAAALVLAIVAFNFGGLLLARGASRGRELAVRAALGAGRGRLLRQLLTESAVLVSFGALGGTLLASGAITFLARRSSIEIPLLQGLQLDGTALAFMVVISALTAVVCGLGPAWRLSRADDDACGALHQQARGGTAGRSLTHARSLLVVLEVALASALAISAGLATRSLQNVLAVDLGYEARDLYALRVDMLRPPEEHAPYLTPLLDRTLALPGVSAAGFTDALPIERDRTWGIGAFKSPTDRSQPDEFLGARVKIVSPGLFDAMNIALLRGRDFTRLDDSEHPEVVILNQRLAQRLFPDRDPIGQATTQGEVIGIVADTRHAGPESPLSFEMYLPYRQQPSGSFDLMVRSSLPLAALRQDLASALGALDPSLPFSQMRPLSELVDRANSSRRMLTGLIGGFAGISLALAALGLYGVIAYTVTQRTKEIGIRMALGATTSAVRADVVGRTLRLAILGLAGGLLLALAANQLMSSLLYGVAAFDLAIYATAAVAVLVCATFAGLLPAARAARVDPMVALRAD
ncbi:ABC transporter permease [Actomonas aquatica]|uniref:ABC transporter permease n=1 Tax=Actomonas aquatica TaxID=2866162 RepID=A0ABZ1C5Q4_9BACT|nr:ABC transporter permease [Opitutus sp. WL0086]WRQ85854.1 ABC transporter permease [Opitutus sp. WL0086]